MRGRFGNKRIRNKLVGPVCVWIAALLGGDAPLAAQILPPAPAPELSSDVYLDEVGHAARSLLEQVKEFLANERWDEAVETLRRVMEDDGDKVIELPRSADLAGQDFTRFVTLRRLAHLRLAEFSRTAPEALALYRNRVDPLAQRWLEEAIEQRDEALLDRIVEQFFTSSYGDDALYRRGEFALERGDYLTARESWERLSPRLRAPQLPGEQGADAPGRPLWLPGRPLWQAWRGLQLERHWPVLSEALASTNVPTDWLAYPDTDIDLAGVRARLVLVSVFEGSLQRAAWELELLRRLHPEATGRIAGRGGSYVELLEGLLEQAQEWPRPPRDSDWTTFGGSGRRWAVAESPVDMRRQPIWQVELPKRSVTEEYLGTHRRRIAEDGKALLSYHPVVQEGTVYVAHGTRIEDLDAFDLQTGQRLWKGLPPRVDAAPSDTPRSLPRGLVPGIQRATRDVGVPRFTLTIAGDRLLARTGSSITGGGRANEIPRAQRSALVAVDVQAERKLLFKIELDQPDWDGNWAFEGPPLTEGGNLYVALRRQDDVRAQMHVACFDMQNRKLRWLRWIAAADTLGHGQWHERTHALLSLQSGRIFVNTNLGVVAALRADDGHISWITRYRRAPFHPQDTDPSDRHFFRDLTPCLVFGNLVLAAPADCDRIFALDAVTGQLIWATAPQQATDVVHLLGVGSGNLIASGDFLYWIDVETGRFVGRFPPPGGNSVQGYGRGLLAGDVIYWPTREAIYVLQQAGPRQTRQPIDLDSLGLTGGNLVISDNVLLIAAPDRLVAFEETGSGQAAPPNPTSRGEPGDAHHPFNSSTSPERTTAP